MTIEEFNKLEVTAEEELIAVACSHFGVNPIEIYYENGEVILQRVSLLLKLYRAYRKYVKSYGFAPNYIEEITKRQK